jgi:hypothetical protein
MASQQIVASSISLNVNKYDVRIVVLGNSFLNAGIEGISHVVEVLADVSGQLRISVFATVSTSTGVRLESSTNPAPSSPIHFPFQRPSMF